MDELHLSPGGPGAVTVRSWKIFYGDGTVVDSREHSWTLAPATDVQVVAVYYEEEYNVYQDGGWVRLPYRELIHSHDYYWQFGGGNAQEALGHQGVKEGKNLPKELWREIYERAFRDEKGE